MSAASSKRQLLSIYPALPPPVNVRLVVVPEHPCPYLPGRMERTRAFLAERMPGFHWMTIYGDYMKEIGYALRRIPIKWEVLG